MKISRISTNIELPNHMIWLCRNELELELTAVFFVSHFVRVFICRLSMVSSFDQCFAFTVVRFVEHFQLDWIVGLLVKSGLLVVILRVSDLHSVTLTQWKWAIWRLPNLWHDSWAQLDLIVSHHNLWCLHIQTIRTINWWSRWVQNSPLNSFIFIKWN